MEGVLRTTSVGGGIGERYGVGGRWSRGRGAEHRPRDAHLLR